MYRNRLDKNIEIIIKIIYLGFILSHRNTIDPASKQSSVANISSYISLMATPTDDDIHSSTKLLTNTTIETQSLTNSSKMNTSMKEQKHQ